MRCERHDLACGPQGDCVLCRREGAAVASRRVVGLIVVAALALIGAAKLAYSRLSPGRQGASELAARADPMATSSGAQSLDAQSTGAGAGTSDSTREERHRIFRAALASASSGLQAAPPTTQPSPRTESGPSTAEPAPSQPNGRPAQVHVVVYTTPWCQYCKKAKAWMNSNGIAYEERDIELSSEYARSMRDINPGGGIPTFDIEGDVMVGFSPDGLTARMRSAAQRRSARSL